MAPRRLCIMAAIGSVRFWCCLWCAEVRFVAVWTSARAAAASSRAASPQTGSCTVALDGRSRGVRRRGGLAGATFSLPEASRMHLLRFDLCSGDFFDTSFLERCSRGPVGRGGAAERNERSISRRVLHQLFSDLPECQLLMPLSLQVWLAYSVCTQSFQT